MKNQDSDNRQQDFGRSLTAEERQEYDEKGYVVPNVFQIEELREIDREIDRILEEKAQNAPGKGWVMQLGLQSEQTRQFAQDKRVLRLIEGIVKPGIAIYSGKLTAKLPHSDEICHWHQDDAYYTQKSISKTRMSTWIPLQNVDEENGCLWVVPGSHRRGLQQHENRKSGQCRFSMNTEAHDFSVAIPCPVKAGDILLFSALLWHHSNGNQTSKVRRAFIVSYQEATVNGGNGNQWKILRTAGEDGDGRLTIESQNNH